LIRSSASLSCRSAAAERAGLKPGDLVTELDGTPVRDDIRFATIFPGGGRPTTSDRPPPRCSQ
jgi:hypothetical protein